MALSTYAELQTAVADFLNRDDLASTVPTFIALAEAAIDRDLRTVDMERNVNIEVNVTDGTVTIVDEYGAVVLLDGDALLLLLDGTPFSGQFVPMPTDFLQPIRFHITGANKALRPMSCGEMQDARYSTTDVTGEPRYYSIVRGALELFPTPATVTSVQAYYYGKVPTLSDATPTNWLLTKAPDVYLYGALVHSAPYLREDGRATVWAAMYQSAIDKLAMTSDAAKWGGGSLRIRAHG